MTHRLGWTWFGALAAIPLLLIGGLLIRHSAAASTPHIPIVANRNVPPATNAALVKLGAVPPPPTVDKPFQMDFTRKDARSLTLSGMGDVLSRGAVFDNTTLWPASLPNEFRPAALLEQGKDPGLGVRKLQAQGLTGAGVHVAILDNAPLWRGHPEYAGQSINYAEVGAVPDAGGLAVISIMSGASVGVAPGVKVSYYTTQFGSDDGQLRDFTYMAAAINRIMDDNRRLPVADRVRVICAPIGASPDELGYEALQAAYRRAMREDVLIVTVDMTELYGYQVMGLGREPYADPNDVRSYTTGSWWTEAWFKNGGKWWIPSNILYVPMEGRTLAAQTGPHYGYYPRIGLGAALPWAAGMYALAVQANPQITPEAFLKIAYETGDYVIVRRDGQTYQLGPIINPGRVIDQVKKAP
ncbi:MAG: hypothetical protein K0R39_1541 [Symbiobacteriaceae bacterium]|jgi:hypothetical protein|nr:hypothetical protein [Symbiobacteriaceae bacterium]